MTLLNLCFIFETGTDFRFIEGLAQRSNLVILGREIENGVMISQPLEMSVPTIVGPPSRSKFAQFVWKYLTENRGFDYVILQNYGLSAIAANLASRFTGTPTAMQVGSPVEAYYSCRKALAMPSKPFQWYELLSLQAIARLNAALGQQYIVVSQHLADVVRHHGAKSQIDVIPVYGVDTKIFVPLTQPKAELRAKLGLPTTGSIIFFSSRVAPEKDSETLLQAFGSLLEKGRDLWLLHRSGGYQTFVKEAEKYGVAQRVIATDAVHPHKELPLSYQACDLCVQSSREEGLGISPLEALACEVPVVATAVGGLKETVIDGQTGWSYSVGNEEALAKCIEEILDNPTEAARRAAAGRDLVCTKYDRQVTFDQFFELLEKRQA